MAKKAVNTDQTKEPAWVVDVGPFVAHAHRRQNEYEQLKQIEQRLQQRLGEVIDTFQRLEKVFPDTMASANDAPRVGPDRRAALADALVALCDTVRQTQFGQGMDLLLDNARREQAGNYQLAFSLYSLGWAQDRTAILDQLNELERLPKQADKFDPRAPSQQGVWQTVSHLFGYLVQCPNHGPEPPEWHPDRLEAARLSAELDKLAGKSGGEDSHARVDPVLENGTTKPGAGPLDNGKEPARELAENEVVVSEMEDGEKESVDRNSPAVNTVIQTPTTLASGQSFCGRRNRGRDDVGVTTKKKGRNIHGRMLATLQQDPDSLDWSARQWAQFLKCSKSTVVEGPAWQSILKARALQKADEISRRKNGQRSDGGMIPTDRAPMPTDPKKIEGADFLGEICPFFISEPALFHIFWPLFRPNDDRVGGIQRCQA